MKLKMLTPILMMGIQMLFADMQLQQEALSYPKVQLDKEMLCDLELLLNGGFSPLKGFMNEADYLSVLNSCRLSDGSVWPLPITLCISKDMKDKVQSAGHLTLADEQNYPLAILDVEEIYAPDVEKECLTIYGSMHTKHSYIQRILSCKDGYYVAGKLRKIALPRHFDFSHLRMTPQECREFFKANGWERVVGFQTRNPLHRCHMALTQYCMQKAGEDAKLLLHPVVGTTQPGDINYWTRVKCYEELLHYYPKNQVCLSLLPLNMRMAGPREALLHALVRKNYGCTHFIVGRDHAGPSVLNEKGKRFFGPYDAHELLASVKDEIGIEIIPSVEIVYDSNSESYLPVSEVEDKSTIKRLSGSKLRQMLKEQQKIPAWFSFPEVLSILQEEYADNRGVCIYFYGLSGSGKSTITVALREYLRASQDRPVVILDGDVIRKYLSNRLGFSKEDRSINVRRIGFVASLIVESGGICLCANIAPYEEDRLANRSLISSKGQYIEVLVDTPLEICESRDTKGLYKAARDGKIKAFTGISDPFEKSKSSEIIIDTNEGIEETLDKLLYEVKKISPNLI